MELNLKNKRALVTAGTYGLGYACAKSLSQEGAQVTICSRSDENVSSAVESIKSETDNKVFGLAADLTNENDLNEVISYSNDTMGGIDILVVCTGHPPTYAFSKATDEDWSLGLDLILHPAIKLTRAVLPHMREQKYGRLIYIGSVFGIEPEVSSVIQSTLRTGLNAFSKCVATENAQEGITSNVICPGYFDTPLCRNLSKQYAEQLDKTADEVWQYWKEVSPMREFGDPEDLGALVTFLASSRARFLTGTAIVIDGGFLKTY